MADPITGRRPRLSLFDQARKVYGRSKEALDAGRTVVESARAVPAQVRAARKNGVRATTRANWRSDFESARNPTARLGRGQATRAYGAVTGAFRLPGQVLATGRELRDAIRNPTRENITEATNSAIGTTRSAVSTASAGLQTARDVQRGTAAYRAADAALRNAAPGMAPSVRRAATRAATLSAFTGATPRTISQATRAAADRAIARSGSSVSRATGAASRTLGRQVLSRSVTAASRAAAPAVARAATSTIARSAGRLVPGVNVAMAALDTAQFVSDMRNPNASTGTRITSGITALGSIAAATNIPVVSQVGAGVAALSSFASGFFGG